MTIIVNIQEYRIMIIIVNIQEYRIKLKLFVYRNTVCNSVRDKGLPALACLANDKDLDQLANRSLISVFVVCCLESNMTILK